MDVHQTLLFLYMKQLIYKLILHSMPPSRNYMYFINRTYKAEKET